MSSSLNINTYTHLLFLLLMIVVQAVPVVGLATNPPDSIHIDSLPKPSKYQGYRLYLTQIKVEKRSSDWFRMTFSAINTGERDIDFSIKGREHWVQVLFDQSLIENNLGGFRDNIRQALYDANFKLPAGKITKNKELKVLKIISWAKKTPDATANANVIEVVEPTEKTTINEDALLKKMSNCPDLMLTGLKILEQKKKHTLLEYTVKNIGKGPIALRQKKNGEDVFIGIRIFLSGAAQVTRASKELDGTSLFAPYYKKELYPSESITHQVKVYTRDRTDFLKYLVFQIDSYLFGDECDRRNNEKSVDLSK